MFYVGSNVFGNANSGFVLFATISLLLLAIILGHFARKDVKNKNLKGGWLALTTLILGYVSLLLVLLGIVAGLAMSNMGEIFGGSENQRWSKWSRNRLILVVVKLGLKIYRSFIFCRWGSTEHIIFFIFVIVHENKLSLKADKRASVFSLFRFAYIGLSDPDESPLRRFFH